MPDTGAPWNIPYVAGTDLVSDWPTDSQTLAEAIADGLDAAGGLKQVVQSTLTSTFTASVAQGGISGAALAVTITPTSATSKVLIIGSLNIAAQAQDLFFGATLYRGGSALFQGDAAGSRQQVTATGWGMDATASNVSIIYLDSPATTSATTYDVRLSHGAAATRNVRMNRAHSDGDANTTARGASSLIAIEVAG